ncbi:MAG: hypothetical protein OEY09_04860, partial [Gammaproteobacteria bacterium]|nr:hypothetical protein [Gammaproteobacteria bacterium]
MPTGTQYFIFGEMLKSIKFVDSSELMEYCQVAFPGWTIKEAIREEPPILTVTRTSHSYQIEGYWLDKPIHRVDKVDAICGLVAEVIRAYVREDSQLLCLHGASAEFAGKLVVFPSQYRSGKSVLSACLAAIGILLYGDDVLPIS